MINEYEKLTLKLKIVELTQNQITIAMLASIINTEEAALNAEESNSVLDAITAYIEKIL